MERLPILANTVALGDLLLICYTLFLKGHVSTLNKCDSEARCTTAACTCRPVLHKEGWAWPNTQIPLFYIGT